MSDAVEWRPVVGYEGYYEVSSDGQVASLVYRSGRANIPRRLLKAAMWRRGYLYVQLWVQGRAKNRTVHSLVAEAFIGPRPDGYDINHRDADRANNDRRNIEYVTPRQNEDHAVSLRLKPHGERNRRSKLTDDQVEEVRRLGALGTMSHHAIARLFGVGRAGISYILRGENRRHRTVAHPHPGHADG